MRASTAILICGLTAGSAQAAGVEFQLDSPVPGQGEYFLAVHNSAETFPRGDAAHGARSKVTGASQRVRVELPPGRYAVSVFQDLNGNGELDTNLIGIPTEPFGFSRNASGSMGPPAFDDAAVEIAGGEQLSIQLRE